MTLNLNSLDRRRFLRGSGVALALPMFESSRASLNASEDRANPKRLACFYFPDGVPMPLPADPAYKEWLWFPHGNGRKFEFTKCFEPLVPLKEDFTVLSGFSHPPGRIVHGHNNADQFLTGAATGGGDMDYKNTISIDQLYANKVGDETRFASLVMSTDGGTGTARGAHTISYNQNGRAIPAEHRPKRIFDMLFVKNNADAARRLALSKSTLDDLLADARSMRKTLSTQDQIRFDEYLESVRETEIKVEKAKKWIDLPLPTVNVDHLNLEITPNDPREYIQTMYELIYLAFRTDSTRVATYQIGRENGVGQSDYLARAVGFNLAHALSHETKNPGGWERFGIYCAFLHEELGRFAQKLKDTPEPVGTGNMLDNTLLFFGSASSAFHLSRNYPIILMGGKQMGFNHGQYINNAGANPQGGPWDGGQEPWQEDIQKEDAPLGNVYVTMLKQLGVQVDSFGGSNGEVKSLVS